MANDATVGTSRDSPGRIPADVRFAPLPLRMLSEPDLRLSHVRVWAHIHDQTLGRPGWNLTYPQVARGAGLQRRAAVDAVAWLLSRGYLVKHRRRRGKEDLPNLYEVAYGIGGAQECTRGSDP